MKWITYGEIEEADRKASAIYGAILVLREDKRHAEAARLEIIYEEMSADRYVLVTKYQAQSEKTLKGKK